MPIGTGSESAACRGKRAYHNKKLAKWHIRQTERLHGERLSAYRCPHCDLWHLGHRRRASEPGASPG